MPINTRKRVDMLGQPTPFTFEQIVNHIEKQKLLLSAKSEN